MSTLIFDLGCFVATVALSVAGAVVARSRRHQFIQATVRHHDAEGTLTPREMAILVQVFEQPFDDEEEEEESDPGNAGDPGVEAQPC